MLALLRAMIRVIAYLVPAPLREDWRREWRGEIWDRWQRIEAWEGRGPGPKVDLLLRCLGAIADAAWLRSFQFQDAWRDLRCGARLLRKSPGFTATAVLALTLGIGCTTAVFSLINAILLRPLPVREPSQLVALYTSHYSGERYGSTSYPDYLDIRKENHSFSGLIAYRVEALSLSEQGRSERVFGEFVTLNYLETLGIRLMAGRGFSSPPASASETGGELDASAQVPELVLSYAFWRRHYGDDRTAIGRPVKVNGQVFTVAGIAPAQFFGTRVEERPDVWLPLGAFPSVLRDPDRILRRDSRSLSILGRLRPRVTFDSAQAEVDVIARQLALAYPGLWRDFKQNPGRFSLVPEAQTRIDPAAQSDLRNLTALSLTAVMIVLLIACGNVANMLLARASVRRREIAIRMSLGAARGRLVRQLLTECGLLSGMGGALGLALAFYLTRLLPVLLPPVELPIGLDVQPDARVLAFAMMLTAGATVAFGLIPALQTCRPHLASALKDSFMHEGHRLSRSMLSSALLISQIALSAVLLSAGGLVVRSLHNVTRENPGFDPSRVLLLSLDLDAQGYGPRNAWNFEEQLLDRVSRLRGVTSAALANLVPLGLDAQRRKTVIEGYQPGPRENMSLQYNTISPNYFTMMRIPLLRGRDFNRHDGEGAPGVVIVNQALARRFWPGQDPVGKHIQSSVPGPRLEVIGEVANTKTLNLTTEAKPLYYLPLQQSDASVVTLHLRTSGDPWDLAEPVRVELRKLDPDLPPYGVKTFEQHLGILLFPSRLAGVLIAALGLLAAVLAAIGVYGVTSYVVAQSEHDVGIRIAVGATTADVTRSMMQHGARIVAIGLVGGLVTATGLMPLLSSWLFRVSPADPGTLAGVVLMIGAVALTATWVPARRACRIDPIRALRNE